MVVVEKRPLNGGDMMAYNPKYNQKNYEYRKNNMKRVGIDFNKKYYENVLKPAADRAGMTVGGFIKACIAEKIPDEHE